MDGNEVIDGDKPVQATVTAADGKVKPVNFDYYHFDEMKRRSEAAKYIANKLLLLFGSSFFLFFGVAAIFAAWYPGRNIDIISDIWQSWLPVVSGFTGSVVTFYFTKDK